MIFAFLCFRIAKVEYAIIEVGIGGRTDYTNVVKPFGTVLMPIEFEHTEKLGDTIEKIAYDKAGIIKNGIPAFISYQNYKDAEEVFLKEAKDKKAECIFTKDQIKQLDYSFSGINSMDISVNINDHIIKSNLKLMGKVEAQNSATAIVTIKKLLPFITDSQISLGLSKACLPGRFEIFNKNIILDGAHTVKSVLNSVETMKEIFKDKKYHLIFSCGGTKNMKEIIPLFKGIFKSITFTESPKILDSDAKKCYGIALENNLDSKVELDLKKAYQSLKNSLGSDEILLITGSFYLVNEIKNIEKN